MSTHHHRLVRHHKTVQQILHSPVSGLNLPVPTLGELLQGEPALLLFLRHHG
jgi:hypothetical protein